jgi:scyllo-inositol 2-dehydrogenase (NAD+)
VAVDVALLGLGRMGWLHAEILARGVPGIRVTAVAEPKREIARRVHGLFGDAVRIYDDAYDALTHPSLGACLIVTPTSTHAELCSAALANGLHVFCEKPLSLDPVRSIELGHESEELGRLVQVGFWRRFAPQWAAARRAIADGAIGSLVSIRSVQWDAEAPPADFCDPEVSGGLLIDCGVHDYDLIEWLSQARIMRVETRALRVVDRGVAGAGDLDNAWVLLTLSDGSQGTVDLSRNGRGFDDIRTEILGSDGAILVSVHPNGEASLRTRGGVLTLHRSATRDAFEEGLRKELAEFARAIAGEVDWNDLPGAVESARALTIGLAARASLVRGGPAGVVDQLASERTG